MKKIALSQKYVLKHLVDRLTAIHDRLCEVDNGLYAKDEVKEEVHDLWHKVRQSTLEIDELIDAIRPE